MTFSTAHRNRFRRVAIASIGLAVSALLGANAQAGEMRKPKEETRSVYLVKYRVNNDVRYNKKPVGKVVKISTSRYLNSNSYVCTPSGFGQKARCYTRGFSNQPRV
jgi:ABC-type transporter Mla subunit MlaD